MVAKFEIFRIENGQEQCWKWRFLDDAEALIGESEATFLKKDVPGHIKKVRHAVETASVVSESEAEKADGSLLVHGKGGEWYLKIGGEIIIRSNAKEGEVDLKVFLTGLVKIFLGAKITWANAADDPANPDKDADRTETKGVPGS